MYVCRYGSISYVKSKSLILPIKKKRSSAIFYSFLQCENAFQAENIKSNYGIQTVEVNHAQFIWFHLMRSEKFDDNDPPRSEGRFSKTSINNGIHLVRPLKKLFYVKRFVCLFALGQSKKTLGRISICKSLLYRNKIDIH